jgi:hypothetical protein
LSYQGLVNLIVNSHYSGDRILEMVATRLARASGRSGGRASKNDEVRALLEREKELESSLRDEQQNLVSEIRRTNDDLELIRGSLKAAEVIEDACDAAETRSDPYKPIFTTH